MNKNKLQNPSGFGLVTFVAARAVLLMAAYLVFFATSAKAPVAKNLPAAVLCEPAGRHGLHQHFEVFYRNKTGQNVGLCSPLRYTALPTYAVSRLRASGFAATTPSSTRRRLAMLVRQLQTASLIASSGQPFSRRRFFLSTHRTEIHPKGRKTDMPCIRLHRKSLTGRFI